MGFLEHTELQKRIESTVNKRIVAVRPIRRGYTPAERSIVLFADGSSLFAKVGTTTATSEWLHRERQVYETLSGPFMPDYLGFIDGEEPILMLEDLSGAYWPPPWDANKIAHIIDGLQVFWSSSPPNLSLQTDFTRVYDGWQQVAAAPDPFLALGMVSERWLEEALPVLTGIDGAALCRGNALVHFDLRSDNFCLRGQQVVIVDWNHLTIGNQDIDLGFWLPSLEAEGGPPPESIFPTAGEIAGIVSGFFAARAGLPMIPDAPHVRHIQQVQLRTALPWAIRALDLPPLSMSTT